MKNKKSYYEILGVDTKANEGEIRHAYHELALKNHPDLYPGNREKEENMKIINEAYLTLKNPAKRAKYDRECRDGFILQGLSSPFFTLQEYGQFMNCAYHIIALWTELWFDSLVKWNRFWFSPVRSKGKREGNEKEEIPSIKVKLETP